MTYAGATAHDNVRNIKVVLGMNIGSYELRHWFQPNQAVPDQISLLVDGISRNRRARFTI
jgi:hypothetical protein